MPPKGSVANTITRGLICIVVLSVLSAGLALISEVMSLKDAEAVNISGSLRMQNYRLVHDISTNSPELSFHIAQYRRSLTAPALAQLNRFYIPENVRSEYKALIARWNELEHQIIYGSKEVYIAQVPDYVDQINHFVLAIQNFSEQKLWLALAMSSIGFITTLCVVFFIIHFTNKKIVLPLNQMIRASESIQNGNFDYPVLNTSLSNELGVLATAFTTMSSELEKLYRSLEEKVVEKTKMLREANRTLAILYECSQILSTSILDEASFKRVAEILSKSESMTAVQLEIHDSGQTKWIVTSGYVSNRNSWHSMPLRQNDETIGVFRWQAPKEKEIHPQLILNIVNILSRSVYFSHSQKQHLQYLLMEERSTIARELHDSLAQALSFLRIQLTLLKQALPKTNNDASIIVEDFDQALSNAYRQLRELLSTFRLTIEEADLNEALHQLILPLQSRTEAKIQLHCSLSSHAINAQQQVHALQIVREAILNAIKHAHANNIIICCEDTQNGYNMFTISDDGKGISSLDEPEGHYGLNIMNERAKRLNGTISIGPRPDGGTLVKLMFPK